MNNEKNHVKTPRRGPGKVNEKPKNFKVAFGKILKSIKSYIPLLIISLILAMLSSILSIIGPNKLRNLTDELSKALVLDEKKVTKITNDIMGTLTKEQIESLNKEILNFNISEEIITKIVTSNEITTDDKLVFNSFLNAITTNDQKNIFYFFLKLPDDITNVIMEDSTINKVLVSSIDKKEYIKIMTENIHPNLFVTQIDKLPFSVQQILLPQSKIENVVISTNDKVKFVSVMSDIDKVSNAKEIYSKVDKLPSNIKRIIEPKVNVNKIKNIIIFLIILYLLSAAFNFIQSFLMAILTNKYAMELREKIISKINRLALKYFDTHKKGDVLSRITNDVDLMASNLSHSLGSLVSAVALFIGSIIMMFRTNWVMAITAIISSLLGFIFMSIVLSKSQKYFLERQKQLGRLNGHIEEIYSNHNVVKAYNGTKDASMSFDELNENVFKCNHMSQFLSGLMPIMMNFIGNLGYVSVCVVGAMLVMNNNITFGVIVAFMIYVRLFTSPLSQIAQGMSGLQSSAAAAERVFEFLEEDEMKDESSLTKKLNRKNIKGNIEFKNVKFSYNDEKVIINNFSCKVKPGWKVAIVGPTGAGKTTLVNLLMKFYDINSGDILIDGVSIKELKRENIHDLFVMVLQDTWLFEGSIKDNVKFNNKKVSEEKVIDSLKIVGVEHFVRSLPNTINYVVKDNDSISQGQKQLLTIARGMLKDAPFLILDEATSSVDTRTEELVSKAMDKLTKNKTSFIIAHRLSTIKNADMILVMKDGNIVEQGNHKNLMKQNGFYAELYNSQFKN